MSVGVEEVMVVTGVVMEGVVAMMGVEDFPQLLEEGMKEAEVEKILEGEEEATEVMEGEEAQAGAQSQALKGQLLKRTSWSILSVFYSLILLSSSIFHSFWGSNGI